MTLLKPILVVFLLQSMVALASVEPVPESIEKLQQRLAKIDTLSAEFVQERTLKVIKKPLVSSGMLYYQKAEGVCWRLKKPVEASVLITDSQVKIVDAAVANSVKTDNPVLGMFSDLLFAVFSGNFESLHQQFHLAWASTPNQWQISLVPKSELMASVADSIEVEGDSVVKRVLLKHNQNDATLIYFKNADIGDSDRSPIQECADEDH